MSDLSPLSGEERKSNFEVVRSVESERTKAPISVEAGCLPFLTRRPVAKCYA